MLSDTELIQEFIKESLRNRDVLLSNPALNAQQVFGQNQLVSKTEGIVLKISLKETPPEFLIKSGSSHWETIAQALAERQFICSHEKVKNGFDRYHYCRVPKGYQLNCTKAVMLWRHWWKCRQRISRLGVTSDLWIRTRETWYPIRDLLCSQGFIFIQTLGSEVSIEAEDLVTWLNKIDSKKEETPPVAQA